MANEPVTTVIGNLTADPEVRFMNDGKPVANFVIASTPRSYDRQSQQWIDGDPLFIRCSVWGDYAQHVADTLTKGTRVISYGKLKMKAWTDKQGNKRNDWRMDVEEVGPSLRFVSAQIQRDQNHGRDSHVNRDVGWQSPVSNQNRQQPHAATQQGFNDSWGGGADSMPPF